MVNPKHIYYHRSVLFHWIVQGTDDNWYLVPSEVLGGWKDRESYLGDKARLHPLTEELENEVIKFIKFEG